MTAMTWTFMREVT
jgi:hypothetical protein